MTMQHVSVKSAAIAAALCLAFWVRGRAFANGHGPLFGLATPTNGKGAWTLDTSFMGRGGSAGNASLFGSMLTYGVTPDLQVSVFAPALLSKAPYSVAQMTAMMPGNGNYEGLLAYRFQRNDFAVGARLESTLYAGVVVPGPQLRTQNTPVGESAVAPGIYTAFASGIASRSHYLWAGIGYTHYAMADGNRLPDFLFYSLVWGYRPASWRWEYPHIDGRWFIELTGSHFDRATLNSAPAPGTSGDQLFIGPSTLWLWKSYGIEAGIQFPVYQNLGSQFRYEIFRWAINFSYFF